MIQKQLSGFTRLKFLSNRIVRLYDFREARRKNFFLPLTGKKKALMFTTRLPTANEKWTKSKNGRKNIWIRIKI